MKLLFLAVVAAFTFLLVDARKRTNSKPVDAPADTTETGGPPPPPPSVPPPPPGPPAHQPPSPQPVPQPTVRRRLRDQLQPASAPIIIVAIFGVIVSIPVVIGPLLNWLWVMVFGGIAAPPQEQVRAAQNEASRALTETLVVPSGVIISAVVAVFVHNTILRAVATVATVAFTVAAVLALL
jgi:hypothetical protein